MPTLPARTQAHALANAQAPAPGSPPDSEVIAASGTDPEQFALLFDRHAPLIHRYIARRVGPEIAEDLVAETFLAAFRNRGRYAGEFADARPWLYGIATNVIGQHRRDEARQLRVKLAAAPDPAEPGHGDRVAADLTARSARGALADALASLPAAERDVLVLIAWEQLSYDETARALEIPVGTVRSRLSRARGRVREVLTRADMSDTVKEILSNE